MCVYTFNKQSKWLNKKLHLIALSLNKTPRLETDRLKGGGGVNRGIQSADSSKFEAKSAIREWSCLNLNPLKALV